MKFLEKYAIFVGNSLLRVAYFINVLAKWKVLSIKICKLY